MHKHLPEKLYAGSVRRCYRLVFEHRYMAGEVLPKAHKELLKKQVKEWRSRLVNVSWFMRILNEKIAYSGEREHRFRLNVNTHSGNVNTYSGNYPKSVHVQSGITVHVQQVRVFTFDRCRCSPCSGICNCDHATISFLADKRSN